MKFRCASNDAIENVKITRTKINFFSKIFLTKLPFFKKNTDVYSYSYSYSYVYFRHKKSIYNKIYIQLDKIYIRIYNNAIQSIRTKKGDFKENIFIMLQCRTTNSKCLRRLEPRSHK